MEIKKNPEVDVRNVRLLLFLIGGIVTLGIVCAVFAFTIQEAKKTEAKEDVVDVNNVEQIEITRQDQPKPVEPPKPQKVEVKVYSEVLKIVTNDTKVETEMNFDEFTEDVEFVNVEVKEEVIEEEQIFVSAEEMPSFQGGGLPAFHAWVQKNVSYPMIAQENGIQGRVLLQFVVEKDGTLGQIKVLQTPDQSLADEAIRVLMKSPKWKPAKQRNKPVRLSFTMPVEFRLQN
jgi:protein TonB